MMQQEPFQTAGVFHVEKLKVLIPEEEEPHCGSHPPLRLSSSFIGIGLVWRDFGQSGKKKKKKIKLGCRARACASLW